MFNKSNTIHNFVKSSNKNCCVQTLDDSKKFQKKNIFDFAIIITFEMDDTYK